MTDDANAVRRDTLTRFKAGNPGGPGRPKGARHRFGHAFLTALLADFERNGMKAIQKVRREQPAAYLRVCAQVVPKQLDVNVNDDLDSYSDDELLARARRLHLRLAELGIGSVAAGRRAGADDREDRGTPGAVKH